MHIEDVLDSIPLPKVCPWCGSENIKDERSWCWEAHVYFFRAYCFSCCRSFDYHEDIDDNSRPYEENDWE